MRLAGWVGILAAGLLTSCFADWFGPRRSLRTKAVAEGGAGGEAPMGGQGGAAKCEPGAPFEWVLHYGSFDEDAAERAAPDGLGGVYVTGRFRLGLDLVDPPIESAGSSDLFLARIGGDGEVLWAKGFGTPGGDHVYGRLNELSATAEGAAIFSANVSTPLDLGGGPIPLHHNGSFVAVFEPDGTHRWTWQGSGPYWDVVHGMAEDPISGDIVVAGSFDEEATFGTDTVTSQGKADAFIAVLDAGTGAVKRHRALGGVGQDYIRGLAIAPSGLIAVGGGTEAPFDLGSGPVPAVSGGEAWIAVLDSDLDVVWGRVFTGVGHQAIHQLVFEPAGTLLATGDILGGTVDLGLGEHHASDGGFIARLDGATGATLADRSWEGLAAALQMIRDPSGAVVIASAFFSDVDMGASVISHLGESDGIAVKLSPQFDPEWSVVLATPSFDGLVGVAPAAGNHVFLSGYFSHTLSLPGCPELVSRGAADMLLIKRAL